MTNRTPEGDTRSQSTRIQHRSTSTNLIIRYIFRTHQLGQTEHQKVIPEAKVQEYNIGLRPQITSPTVQLIIR